MDWACLFQPMALVCESIVLMDVILRSFCHVGWRKIVTPSLNSGTDPFSYPYLGNPIAFAISPFEEYYAIGGLTENATNPVPEFAYSNDFGNSWTTPTQSIPFSQPGLGDQVVHSISFGAGQFVITGGTELRCGGNCGPAANRTLNTVSTARGPSTFQGLGKAFFHYIDGSPPRQARDSGFFVPVLDLFVDSDCLFKCTASVWGSLSFVEVRDQPIQAWFGVSIQV
jgi:hypothetical protein